MSCKIVIPSHKRAERVLSKTLVLNPIICVARSQVDSYKEFNQECEIVAHPDDVVGLPAKRNWMVNHFGELFMIDDDVYLCSKRYIEKGENPKVGNPEDVTAAINWLYELAKMIGVSCFGFSNKPHPLMYNEFEPISLRHMITGCNYGIIKSPNTFWPSDKITVKEDFWISCYIKYKERKVLTDDRYYFSQKDTMVNAGGLAEYRNNSSEMSSIMFIKKCFGDSIKLKKTSITANKLNHNISCSFKL